MSGLRAGRPEIRSGAAKGCPGIPSQEHRNNNDGVCPRVVCSLGVKLTGRDHLGDAHQERRLLALSL